MSRDCNWINFACFYHLHAHIIDHGLTAYTLISGVWLNFVLLETQKGCMLNVMIVHTRFKLFEGVHNLQEDFSKMFLNNETITC